MRPKKSEIIKRQINIWKERVWMPDIEPDKEKNKETGEIELVLNKDYENIYKKSDFSFVFFNDKEGIYKFLRYGIESSKIYNSNIIFARPSLFNAYISVDGSLKDSYNLCKEMIGVIAKEYENKWLVCDDLSVEFDDKLATYFLSQIQSTGAKGIIFHCDKKIPNNLYSCVKTSKAIGIIEI